MGSLRSTSTTPSGSRRGSDGGDSGCDGHRFILDFDDRKIGKLAEDVRGHDVTEDGRESGGFFQGKPSKLFVDLIWRVKERTKSKLRRTSKILYANR